MKKLKPVLFAVFLSSSLMSAGSYAQFRCEGQLIENDKYSKLDVQRYCGEPALKDSYTKSESVDVSGKTTGISCATVDQWYYSHGPNKTTYVVEFEKGFVSKVVRGADKP